VRSVEPPDGSLSIDSSSQLHGLKDFRDPRTPATSTHLPFEAGAPHQHTTRPRKSTLLPLRPSRARAEFQHGRRDAIAWPCCALGCQHLRPSSRDERTTLDPARMCRVGIIDCRRIWRRDYRIYWAEPLKELPPTRNRPLRASISALPAYTMVAHDRYADPLVSG
jgi:hypothetical protein